MSVPEFPLTRSVVPELVVLASAESTNDELVRVSDSSPELTTVVTLDQRAGRGRMGREWVTPAGTALAASVLLRPDLPVGSLGWVSLIAGLSMTRTLRAEGVSNALLKWPNDVLVGGEKVSGILSELRPDGGVVVGVGVNLAQSRDQLPVPNATSLALLGVAGSVEQLADSVLAGFVTDLARTWTAFASAGGDAHASGVHAQVVAHSGTIGEAVRVTMPEGAQHVGVARGLNEHGHLVVRKQNGDDLVVAAGDVTHVRYE